MNYDSIISADDTFQHLNDPDWRIIDCRYDLSDPAIGFEKYQSSHIPNAIYADLKTALSSPVSESSGRHPLPTVSTLTAKLGNWGIGENTQVVVYDDVSGSFAGRLWWLLNWLGHSKVAVLNGGLTYWQRQGLPLTATIIIPKSTAFNAHPNMDMVVNTRQIEQLLSTNAISLIDVRDPERFAGITEPIDAVAGHIPGALNIPWKSNIDTQGLFLPKTDLLTRYQHIIPPNSIKNLVFMCGSGVTACHGLIAMKYLGYEGAKLYPGSWSEWIRDPKHPIETSPQ